MHDTHHEHCGIGCFLRKFDMIDSSGIVMTLTTTNASVIRAIKQRELLNEWIRLYAHQNRPPRLDDYRPERLSDEMQDIMLCTVGTSVSGPRIVIQSDCKRMHPAFGPSGVGQNLADYFGETIANSIIPFYVEAIDRQRPVYSISRVEDCHGRVVDYERLLMPFAEDGCVTHIMASLKAISEDGHFEILNLMRGATAPVPVLAGLIGRDLAPRVPERTSAGDIEFH